VYHCAELPWGVLAQPEAVAEASARKTPVFGSQWGALMIFVFAQPATLFVIWTLAP
jgi:hypothetical protein